MNNPDWKDAPQWARFAAMEKNAGWYWYENRPTWNESRGTWCWPGGRTCHADIGTIEDSLQERPRMKPSEIICKARELLAMLDKAEALAAAEGQ